MSETSKGLLFASGTALLWGFLAIAVKVALDFVPLYNIVWVRFFIAFTILFIYKAIKDPKALKIFFNPPLLGVIGAICLAFNYWGFLSGIHYTSPSSAQLVIQCGPISLALIGIFFFKETINSKQLFGFLLAAIGLSLFYQDQIKQFIGGEDIYNRGVFLTFLGAIAWAIYSTFNKILVKRFPPQDLNLLTYGIPSLLFIPKVELHAFQGLSLNIWLLLIFLGLNTLFAYGFLIEAFKRIPANNVSVIITVNPTITMVVMALLTHFQVGWIKHEHIEWVGAIGALMLISGAICIVKFRKV